MPSRLFAVALLLLFVAVRLGAEAKPEPEQADLLVTGGTVVTMDAERRLVENGAVAIRGARIVAVGPAGELKAKFQATTTLDATGRVVMPGFINTHTHAPMVLFRGLADDLALMDWLRTAIFPAEAKNVDEEFVRWGTKLACLEMLKAGITTYVDMYYFEDALAEETARAGMRGVLGQTLIDFPAPDFKTWTDATVGCDRYLRKWKGHPLITPAVAPHAPHTVSPQHLQEARALARRHEVPFLIHVAESQDEVKAIREKHGLSPVAYLEKLGVLDEQALLAHMVWPEAEDLQTLARRKAGVAHCPTSNLKLASGTAPVAALLKAGVAVGLGTDGAASNNVLSPWREMDLAAKLHKLATMDPKAMPARTALELATLGGARALGREKDLGSLEAGKLADLIVVRMDSPHQTPLYDVPSQLVYTTQAADVESVVVNGKLVMEGRRVLTVDEPATLAKAREYAVRIKKSVGR